MPRGASRVAPHERVVATLDRALRQLLHERVVRARGARDHHEPARVAVEAVHDPGPERVADRRDLGIAREQAVHERAATVPGTRVHHEARRLGNDDDVVVLVADVDLDLGFGLRRRGRHGLVEQLDDLTGAQAMALADRRCPSTSDRARVQQRLHVAAAPAGEQRDGAIDAFAVERRAGTSIGSAALTARSRRAHGALTLGDARSVPHTRMIAPIVMHESAKLNTGN